MWVSKIKSLRWSTVVLGVANVGVIVMAGVLLLSASTDCSSQNVLPLVVVGISSAIRIMSMIGTARAQEATAATILSSPTESAAIDVAIRHERRMRYKKWLWWTRFGMAITILQFLGAAYLMFVVLKSMKYVSISGTSSVCFLGASSDRNRWEQSLLVSFLILLWFMVILQCFTGSDVLRWRSFYATHDNAWKAHYREVFDHGIREVLCCLGRVKYLSVLEEDEVYSVARLLGDLVAYRASGTGHLEFLAGLALLQRHRQPTIPKEDLLEAPEEQIREAAAFHQFAEAAYTGPLLDFGRNPILFPCAWLYRQGVVTPWTRSRRPVLEGDNWWRGHAAAFLKYVNLSPEALRRGRVNQAKCEAAYFVVVLHHIRTVVVSVRGTETPEDLITDGLCRECTLSMSDLDGLVSGNNIHPRAKQNVISSFPHHGHSGIVEAARELFMQVDGQPEHKDATYDSTGFLSSLLGAGCECEGYDVRIVGHSLGGSIATLLGLRLYGRYPNLRVYAYGPLPCVDSIIAEACSDFVTSIIYNDEFSARLSVNSILRLRAASITALSQDASADTAMICGFTRRLLQVSKYQKDQDIAGMHPSLESAAMTADGNNHHKQRRRYHSYTIKGSAEQDQEFAPALVTDFTENSDAAMLKSKFDECNFCDRLSSCTNPCLDVADDEISCEDAISEFMGSVPSSNEKSVGDPPEMYLPGLIILILPERRTFLPLWKEWKYNAYVANRESFKDIVVSPFMFLDHLPWRCHYALQKILEARQAEALVNESNIV